MKILSFFLKHKSNSYILFCILLLFFFSPTTLYAAEDSVSSNVETHTLCFTVDETKIVELKYILADLYIKVNDNEKSFEMYEKIHKSDEQNLEVLILKIQI